MQKYGYKTKKSITDKVKKHYPDLYNQIIEEAHNNRRGFSYSIEKIKNSFDGYLIGLLLTDGYILSDRDGFGLDMTDEDVISFVAKGIGTTYKKYTDEIHKPRYRVTVSIPGLKQQLKRFGVVSRKSLTLQPPLLLPDEKIYLPYIIRGIIDGDGCVSKTSYGGAQFYICTISEKFAKWLKYIFEEVFFMEDIHIKQNHLKMYRVETANQYNILKLIALIYNKPFGMNRKYNFLRRTFRDYNNDALLDKDDGIVQTTTE